VELNSISIRSVRRSKLRSDFKLSEITPAGYAQIDRHPDPAATSALARCIDSVALPASANLPTATTRDPPALVAKQPSIGWLSANLSRVS